MRANASRRQRWWWWSVVAAAAVLASCGEQSRVAPDAEVTVVGRIADTDGSAAAGRPVRLGTGITDGEGALAVLTVGLSCTTGACTGEIRDAVTDGDGHFSFTLRGRDTQSSFGEAVSVLVSATGERRAGDVSGPMTSARFRIQQEHLTLPALELVDPGLSLAAADGQVRATWEAARPAPYELTFEAATAVPVWRAQSADPAVSVDPRVLEDTAGRVVVAGRHDEAVPGSGVEIRWRSPGVPYAGGAGVPPSRGRPCRYVDAAGTEPGGEPSGVAADHRCALTDGDLTAAAAPPICPGTPDDGCHEPVAAVLPLAEAVPAELVVVRGCDGGCAVDVSEDGTTFRPAGAVPDGHGAVALDGRPVRAVRVGLGSVGLREVSVWGPPPERALLPIADDEAAELSRPYTDGEADGDNGLTTPLALVAAAAAATALVGTGVALGRRSRG